MPGVGRIPFAPQIRIFTSKTGQILQRRPSYLLSRFGQVGKGWLPACGSFVGEKTGERGEQHLLHSSLRPTPCPASPHELGDRWSPCFTLCSSEQLSLEPEEMKGSGFHKPPVSLLLPSVLLTNPMQLPHPADLPLAEGSFSVH